MSAELSKPSGPKYLQVRAEKSAGCGGVMQIDCGSHLLTAATHNCTDAHSQACICICKCILLQLRSAQRRSSREAAAQLHEDEHVEGLQGKWVGEDGKRQWMLDA